MRLKKINTLIITVAGPILLLFGCALNNNPIKEDFVKSPVRIEKKWLADAVTGEKLSVIGYKEFDKKGDLVLWIEYYENGNKKIETAFVYYADRITEDKTSYNDAGDIREHSLSDLYTDNAGNLLKKVSYNENGDTSQVIEYEYDEYGNVTAIKYYTDGGQRIRTESYKYKYNNKGDVIERVLDPSDDGSFDSKDILLYDAGNKVERIVYDSTGSVRNKLSYLYNTYGRLNEEIHFDPEGNVLKKIVYDYEYF